MLIETTGAIDDRWRRLVLSGDAQGDAHDFIILGVDELEQRMADQSRVC